VSADYVNLLTLRGGGHSISGTLAGPKAAQRIVNIDDTPFDVPPVDNMVVIQNDDRPGVIGTVGTLLGNAGVNISDMDVSRVTGSDTAVMLIAPSAPVPGEVLDALRAAPGILEVTSLSRLTPDHPEMARIRVAERNVPRWEWGRVGWGSTVGRRTVSGVGGRRRCVGFGSGASAKSSPALA
jgi:predicted amino acid-binding ACT domain protein